MSALLELHDLHTSYGLSRVLFGISLEVKQGECVCLLGRNGVGKTTTMRSVMGLTPPSAGAVRFRARDITGWPPVINPKIAAIDPPQLCESLPKRRDQSLGFQIRLRQIY